MRIALAFLLITGMGLASDDLEKLRDRQDRAGLTQSAAALSAAAEKSASDANGWYRAALAQAYIAEVAMEMNDKGGSQHAAEEGARYAEKAISLNDKTADYYRVLGMLCGQ